MKPLNLLGIAIATAVLTMVIKSMGIATVSLNLPAEHLNSEGGTVLCALDYDRQGRAILPFRCNSDRYHGGFVVR